MSGLWYVNAFVFIWMCIPVCSTHVYVCDRIKEQEKCGPLTPL